MNMSENIELFKLSSYTILDDVENRVFISFKGSVDAEVVADVINSIADHLGDESSTRAQMHYGIHTVLLLTFSIIGVPPGNTHTCRLLLLPC